MRKNHDTKKHVTLTFIETELLYDIKNMAFVEADIMLVEDEHQKHHVFDVCEDGNIDRVRRVLNLAFARCVEFCYPYTKTLVTEGTALDDIPEEKEQYKLELTLPYDVSETSLEYMRHYIHEYLVAMVLADWLSITYPQAAEKWAAKASGAETEIVSSLNGRAIRRRRRTQTPF